MFKHKFKWFQTYVYKQFQMIFSNSGTLFFFEVGVNYIYVNILVHHQYKYTSEFQKNKKYKKSLEIFCHESIQNHVRNRFPMSLCKWFFGAKISLHKILRSVTQLGTRILRYTRRAGWPRYASKIEDHSNSKPKNIRDR